MLVDYINIFQGTDSCRRYSQGNTLPLVCMPNGMNAFSLQTSSERENWFFNPNDKSLEGIRLTHQPSPWVGDYGALVIMPQKEELYLDPSERYSAFSIENSVITPGYIKTKFLRYGASVELSPTIRGAAIRFLFDKSGVNRVCLLPLKGNYYYKIDAVNNVVTGYTDCHTSTVPENFKMHFAVRFDKPIDIENSAISNGCKVYDKLEFSSEMAGIGIAFKENIIEASLAVSYISEAQAMLNLRSELEGKSFDNVKELAENTWESKISKITFDAGDEFKSKFYSCLYRTMLFPHTFFEYNSNGEAIYYHPTIGEVCAGEFYTDTGFWDTYRTLFPLVSILDKELHAKIVKGFINYYEQCGWLPRWLSPGEVGIMPGTLVDGMIADAAVKGLLDENTLRSAFKGMIKHSVEAPNEKRFGRVSAPDYNTYGYVPCDLHKESVSQTLDNVYGDFCVSVVADLLNEKDIAQQYRSKSNNYKNLFDESSQFMRGKKSTGEFIEKFTPFLWGGQYCEGGPWQHSFSVFHDLDGLAELFSGREALIKKLDELFDSPPYYELGYYNLEIHEMTEMALANFGQCAISNQPSFHLPFIYAALGEKEKASYWIKRIVNEAFSDNHFPGDEDNGSMAAWFVFATLGIYPLCPGKDEYVCSTPLVENIVINGRKLNNYHTDSVKHSIIFE